MWYDTCCMWRDMISLLCPGGGGEIDSLNVVNVSDCVDVIRQNRDMVVGIKLRLALDISDNGKNEQEAYR